MRRGGVFLLHRWEEAGFGDSGRAKKKSLFIVFRVCRVSGRREGAGLSLYTNGAPCRGNRLMGQLEVEGGWG